jgi:hypothetical protein
MTTDQAGMDLNGELVWRLPITPVQLQRHAAGIATHRRCRQQTDTLDTRRLSRWPGGFTRQLQAHILKHG